MEYRKTNSRRTTSVRAAALQGKGTSKQGFRWFYLLVDFLLILAVLLGVLLVYAIWSPDATAGEWAGERRTVEYCLEITDMYPGLAAYARQGMTVTDFETGEALGTLVTAEARTQADGKSTLLLTLVVEAGYLPEKGYYAGDFRVAVGNEVAVRFDRVYGSARCVAVNVAADAGAEEPNA